MINVTTRLRVPLPLLFVFTGAAAGAMNGLLGTGGGIITFFVLTKIYANDGEYSTKDVFATTYAASALMSVASVFFNLSRGSLDISEASPYMLPAVAGGILGAVLLDKLNAGIFKKLFALLVIWAGTSMMAK